MLCEHVILLKRIFAKSRTMDSSAVKIRFRVMTEVDRKANVLKQQSFPLIRDNTLSLIVPAGSNQDTKSSDELVAPDQLDTAVSPMVLLRQAAKTCLNPCVLDDVSVGTIRHPLNGSLRFIAQSSFHIDQSVST